MASRIFLLCLFVSCLTVNYIECGRSGGRSRGGGGGRSRGGFSFGFGSSSHGSKHSWSSSSSSSSHSSGSHGYPSSSSGLSGYGSGHHSYPSSSSGLSGHGSNSHTYPSSSSGLSGYGSSSSGPTWHFGSSSYPSSSSGLSGSGSSYRPTSNHHYHHTNVHYSSHPPTYYSAPQYVYVQDYRNSDSRYGDLLTGLSLYNLGRSHSHYHNHYYYDDYYRHRYDSPSYGSSSYSSQNKPQDEANCVLKVKENGREEALKIPCEIVSTFTQDSKKVDLPQQTQVNKTKCTTTITNKPMPVTTTSTTTTTTTEKPFNGFPDNFDNLSLNEMLAYADAVGKMTLAPNGTLIMPPVSPRGQSSPSFTLPEWEPTKVVATTEPPHPPVTTVTTETSSVNGTVSYITKTVTTNATMVNVTVCTTNSTFVDPLSAKGSPVDPNNMECAVEIQTKDAYLRNVVDCKTLMKYAKMPEPKPDTGILPPREKLKTWLDNPPWWMSLFIAV
ncbi:unnamed protein product [Spodoptera littoralis]|uniref:Uncharacterized protein n=1 Tax=Spodoptera littoralis TaxID=7109 RepID=A0A9P0IFI8_SPOLI|nr:unnamed protein product [Spodoptera littoralis]CAH1645900.1 unnamed protein product [Spodoptera littoralis]